MDVQVIEGTIADIQRQLIALPIKPTTRLRVVVTEPSGSCDSPEALLSTATRRNGLILLPNRGKSGVITTELVNELSEDQ